MLANDATMKYVVRELGWARKFRGGMDGADPGAVGWVSFSIMQRDRLCISM
jgi:hypothetical protein